MLPEDEQRQLQEIEQALCREDPKFVRLMRTRPHRHRGSAGHRRASPARRWSLGRRPCRRRRCGRTRRLRPADLAGWPMAWVGPRRAWLRSAVPQIAPVCRTRRAARTRGAPETPGRCRACSAATARPAAATSLVHQAGNARSCRSWPGDGRALIRHCLADLVRGIIGTTSQGCRRPGSAAAIPCRSGGGRGGGELCLDDNAPDQARHAG